MITIDQLLEFVVRKKRYSFSGGRNASGTGVAVEEFVAYMPTLEKAHHCPVRMVKAVWRFGFIKIYYELIKEQR